MKHTPAPWAMDSEHKAMTNWIISTSGKETGINVLPIPGEDGITKAGAWANAAHIVHCVNIHGQLVEALEEIRGFLMALTASRSFKKDAEIVFTSYKASGVDRLNTVDNALALARKKT